MEDSLDHGVDSKYAHAYTSTIYTHHDLCEASVEMVAVKITVNDSHSITVC